MAWLGPVPWWTAVAAAGWVAVVSGPVAVLARSRALRTAAGGPGRSWRSGVPLVPGALAVTARRGALLLRARAYGAVTRLAGAPGVPTAPGAAAATAPGAPGGPAR